MSEKVMHLTDKERFINVFSILLLFSSLLWFMSWVTAVVSMGVLIVLSYTMLVVGLALPSLWDWEGASYYHLGADCGRVALNRLLMMVLALFLIVAAIFTGPSQLDQMFRLLVSYPWFALITIILYESAHIKTEERE